MNKNYTIKDLINENKQQFNEYRNVVSGYENKGLENLSYDELNSYEVYLGKLELSKIIIEKLEKINLVK